MLFQLQVLSGNLVDSSKTEREIAHLEAEDALMTTQSFPFLSVKSVLTNNLVVISHFVFFTIQRDKKKQFLRQM